MKVKMLTHMAGPNEDRHVGSVQDLDDNEACRLCVAEFAEPVDDAGARTLAAFAPDRPVAEPKERISEPRSRKRNPKPKAAPAPAPVEELAPEPAPADPELAPDPESGNGSDPEAGDGEESEDDEEDL